MTSVQAKFKCDSVVKRSESETITLIAVTNGKDNETWSKYTPSGKLEFMVTNPNVNGYFVPGVEYYLNITKVN